MTKPNLAQLRRLVGNPSAYAVQNDDGSWRPVREPLTDDVLKRHLSTQLTVGTYVGHRRTEEVDPVDIEEGPRLREETVARTLVFDVDSGLGSESDALVAALQSLGIPKSATGVEFSGRKGFHVWVPLQGYRPNEELRRVGRAVLAIADVKCEVFPKQDEVRDLGNLVKLPGSKHRVTGHRNDFVGAPPMSVNLALWDRVLEALPPEQRARQSGPVESRFPCLEAIQDGVAEGGRNISLFHLATMCRRHGLTDESVSAVLHSVNAKNEPPVDDVELEGVLLSSRTSGPICDQLADELQDACGDYCIKARLAGLHTRPGQLRNASDGEGVVLRVVERAGTAISLEHEDLQTVAKGRLRVREEKD